MKQLDNVSPSPSGRWSKILIIGTIFVPMLLAYIVFQTGIGIPTGTINQGTLVQPPLAIQGLSLADENGVALNFSKQAQKWRLVVPVFGQCGDTCLKSLYVTRQVHTRLNEKYPRVERWLLTDIKDPAFYEMVERDYPQVAILQGAAEDWSAFLAKSSASTGDYFMMDQNGFVMMAYLQEKHTGNDLLKDLKRMLKFSREH